MYKMIVVDDEYLARIGIKETIDWESFGITIVDTAVNGKDALEKIEQNKPDIIISDIKMPVMDGTELVAALYERNYDGVIIMLSGYNDFEYAKATLEKGVFKYLLKPVDNDELVSVVLQAVEKLNKQRKIEKYISDFSTGIPVIKSRIVDSLFHGEYDEADIREKLSLYDLPVLDRGGVALYCKADPSCLGNDVKQDEHVRKSLTYIQQEISKILINHKVLYSQTDKRVAFVTDFCDVDALEKSLISMLRNYEKQFKVLISIGISSTFEGLSGIAPAFGAAKFIATNRVYAINSVATVKAGENTDKTYKRHIVEALKYISEHYSDNELKIKTVADHLYVSESYLMHLFKQELDKTFNTCLTEYRIMIAKRLLIEQKYKVYEIAEMVGYLDMKYFGQVFRKMENCTPSEYVRKQNEKKS